MNDSGWAVWVTGLPASGKSTVTNALKKKLSQFGVKTQILESDIVRKKITPCPTYTPEEREKFYNMLIYIGILLTQNDVNVIFDATANKRRWRRATRTQINRFLEVYIRCPIEECMKRDPKGLYRRAATGEASHVPGVQDEYEEPFQVEVELECIQDSPQDSADKIIEVMRNYGFI